ncbi:hypothetical protein AtNW77_Chr3g0197161 [Arabidopsis thaliana]
MRTTQQESSSPGHGFTNYFETGQMLQTPKPRGLFNIGEPHKGQMQVIKVIKQMKISFVAFRTCQLRSEALNNLNYEERIELWNLENEQFEELVIQPALIYYDRYFQRAPTQTDGGLGWRNIWRRLQQDDAACLQLLRMSLPCFTTLCNMLQTNYGLQPTLNVSIEESVAMFLRICGQ